VHVLAPPRRALAPGSEAAPAAAAPAEVADDSAPKYGSYALVVARLAPEKGIDVAIDACRSAGVPLVVAGDGPELAVLQERAARGRRGAPAGAVAQVRFAGRVDDAELARLRAGASIALVPSRSPETFGLAAAEAMSAGLPVAASRVGALPELVEEGSLVPPNDPDALARAIARLAGDRAAGERGLARVRALCAPEVVADALAELYDGA
jgi:glycosyltransferase involved in cell wall biosynthesis